MDTKIIDGRTIAAAIRAQAASDIKDLKLDPGLGVVIVGDDPASHLYVGLKEKACGEVGIRFEKFALPATASTSDVLEVVRLLNRREDIDAVLVQLPLPGGIDANAVTTAISPAKDVDGFHPQNLRAYLSGEDVMTPGLVTSVLSLVEAAGIDSLGKRAVIVGNSRIFTEPLAKGLATAGFASEAVVDIEAAPGRTREADLVVVAVGRPGWLDAEKTKAGAVIIDVGTTKVGERTVGDADVESLAGHAAALTPVPGGVGPVTVATLVKNTVELSKKKRAPQ